MMAQTQGTSLNGQQHQPQPESLQIIVMNGSVEPLPDSFFKHELYLGIGFGCCCGISFQIGST